MAKMNGRSRCMVLKRRAEFFVSCMSSTHEIVAAEQSYLCRSVPKLTRLKVIEISRIGFYVTRGCRNAIKIKRAVTLIQPREGAIMYSHRIKQCKKIKFIKLMGYGYRDIDYLKSSFLR